MGKATKNKGNITNEYNRLLNELVHSSKKSDDENEVLFDSTEYNYLDILTNVVEILESDSNNGSNTYNNVLEVEPNIILSDSNKKTLLEKSISKINKTIGGKVDISKIDFSVSNNDEKESQDYLNNYVYAICVIIKILDIEGYYQNNKGKSGNVVEVRAIPSMIKIVVNIMIYRAYELAEKRRDLALVSQQALLKLLGMPHNSITKWGAKPYLLYQLDHFKHAESPLYYMGQKINDYSVAIRNLEYQLRKQDYYEDFYDLFGGSGNASSSVIFDKNKNYYYNEYDPIVNNVIITLSTKELYEDLIKAIKYLQIYINNDCEKEGIEKVYDELEKITGLDFWDKLRITSEMLETIVKDKSFKSTVNQTEMNQAVYIKPLPITFSYEDYFQEINKGILDILKSNINKGWAGETDIEIDSKKMTNKDLFDKLLLDNKLVTALADNYQVFQNLAHVNLFFDDLEEENNKGNFYDNKKYFNDISGYTKLATKLEITINGYQEYNNHKHQICMSIEDINIDFMHAKAFELFYLFKSIVIDKTITCPQDRILKAIAMLYLRCCTFSGNEISENSIIKLDDCKNTMSKFRTEDFITKVETFHKCISTMLKNGDNITQKDCSELLLEIYNKYYQLGTRNIKNVKRALIYSDSPYLGTAEYDVGFDEHNMYDLIHNLIYSQQYFIFSCRAIYNKRNKATEDEKNKAIIAEKNKAIIAMFNNFYDIVESYNNNDEYHTISYDELISVDDSNDKRPHQLISEKLSIDDFKKMKLYVLVILEGIKNRIIIPDNNKDDKDNIDNKDNKKEKFNTVDDAFIDAIKNNKVIEVMICNYKIHDFEDYNASPNTVFKVYTFDEFLDIVKNNANI